jgi:hypothetical protein
MDISKFKTHDWLVIAGGIGAIIFGLFFDWWKVQGFVSGANAFDFFFTGTVPWLLLVAAAVVTVLLATEKLDAKSLPWPLVIALVTLVAAILLLIRFVFNPGAPDGVDRGTGLILTFIAGLVGAAGGVMGFMASGGAIADFADINKMKSAFDKGDKSDNVGGGSPMPPPPPPPL